MYSLTDADSFSELDAVRTDVLHVKDVDVTPPMGTNAIFFLCVILVALKRISI